MNRVRAEFGRFVRPLMAGGAAIACAVTLAGIKAPSVSAEGFSAVTATRDCDSYPRPSGTNNHEREVCNAYKHNTFGIALRDFYIFGNNKIEFLASKFRDHLETRYFATPLQTIERQVDSWGETDNPLGNEVHMHVNLYGSNPISSNLKADRAIVRIQQTVDVYSGDTHQSFYHEPLHVQNLTMCRGKLPEDKGIFGLHVLHSWFVVKNVADPNFNCIAFDRQHNIQP